jgi:hypothetical protein
MKQFAIGFLVGALVIGSCDAAHNPELPPTTAELTSPSTISPTSTAGDNATSNDSREQDSPTSSTVDSTPHTTYLEPGSPTTTGAKTGPLPPDTTRIVPPPRD